MAGQHFYLYNTLQDVILLITLFKSPSISIDYGYVQVILC